MKCNQTWIPGTDFPPSWSFTKDRLTILSGLKDCQTAEQNKKKERKKLKIMYRKSVREVKFKERDLEVKD